MSTKHMEIEQMYRIKDVLKRVPISRSLIYKLTASGLFPAPVKLSERTSLWRAEDVNNWLRSRGVKI